MRPRRPGPADPMQWARLSEAGLNHRPTCVEESFCEPPFAPRILSTPTLPRPVIRSPFVPRTLPRRHKWRLVILRVSPAYPQSRL